MFESYTEKARRVIFYARYEASDFGSPFIETEHFLLGLLREDKALIDRFLRKSASSESIRKQIEMHSPPREKIPTNVDLPLSNECKRVLAYSAEEAMVLGQKYVGVEHLLLGLLREKGSFGAALLKERGVKLDSVRSELRQSRSPFPAEGKPGRMRNTGSWINDLNPVMSEEELKDWYLHLSDSDKVICLALVSAQLTIHGRLFEVDLAGEKQSNALIGLNEVQHKLSNHIVGIAAKQERYPDSIFWNVLSEKASQYGLSSHLAQSFQFASTRGLWKGDS